MPQFKGAIRITSQKHALDDGDPRLQSFKQSLELIGDHSDTAVEIKTLWRSDHSVSQKVDPLTVHANRAKPRKPTSWVDSHNDEFLVCGPGFRRCRHFWERLL